MTDRPEVTLEDLQRVWEGDDNSGPRIQLDGVAITRRQDFSTAQVPGDGNQIDGEALR